MRDKFGGMLILRSPETGGRYAAAALRGYGVRYFG